MLLSFIFTYPSYVADLLSSYVLTAMDGFPRTSIDSDSQFHGRVPYCARTSLPCCFLGTGERTGPNQKSVVISLPVSHPPRVLIFLSLCLNQSIVVTQHFLFLHSSYKIIHKVLITLHSLNIWIWSLIIMSLSSRSHLLSLHPMCHPQGQVSQHELVEYGNYSIYKLWISLVAYRLTIILLT